MDGVTPTKKDASKAMSRRSFRSRLGIIFSVLSIAVGLPAYFYAGSVHRNQIIADKKESLQALAISTAIVLSENLVERRREIELLAQMPLYRRASLDSSEFRASLERLQKSYPHYSWIGLTDAGGKVIAATSDGLLGQNVSSRPWFKQGTDGVFVGDLHETVLPAGLMPPEPGSQSIRFLDFAAPVKDDNGDVRGVLAAHAHWRWAGDLLNVAIPRDTTAQGLEIYIVSKDNVVIYPDQEGKSVRPPRRDVLRHAREFQDWGDGATYLTAFAAIREPASSSNLGWHVVVRQRDDFVLAEVKDLQRAMIGSIVVAALTFLVLAWLAAESVSRPVRQLTDIARRIRRGEERISFDTYASTAELNELSEALSEMAARLMTQQRALEASNRDLETRVGERTQELQR